MLLAEEEAQPMSWWCLSYADKVFRGAVIVQASGFLSAVARANELQINPGGEVAGFEILEEALPLIPENQRNRLLTRAEVEAFGFE